MANRADVAFFWRRAIVLSLAAVFLAPAFARAQTDFIEKAAELGIDAHPTTAFTFDFGSGAAFVDIDGDGDLDLYVVMGHGERNRFYRYDSETKTYTDVAGALGCADAGNGKAVNFADYDNDGDKDLFVANMDGTNRLYRNDGGTEFRDVTSAAGLVFEGRSHGAAWGDYDNDGNLDLYIAMRNRNLADKLYRNRGNGTFADVSVSAGIAGGTPPNFDCVWIDYDRDGDQDVYVTTDGTQLANQLYRNNGNNKFTEVAASVGAQGFIDGMGIAVGDYDNDGWEDIYVTHTGFVSKGHILLHSDGNGKFNEVAVAQGVAIGQYGWGCDFLDYDNDGDLDLYVVHWAESPGSNGAINRMYRNDLAAKFVQITDAAGVGDSGKGFGLATGDYNGDGYLDMFVLNRDSPSVFYENTLSGNNWLGVRTIGRKGRAADGAVASNRDGIGARVVITTGAGDQLRVIRSGNSYLSMSSIDAHFGVGDATKVDRVEITWPSGIVDEWMNIDVNQTLTVCEGGWPVDFTNLSGQGERNGSVELDWSLLCDGVMSGFRIYRAREVDGNYGAEEPLGFVDATARHWVDDTVEPLATYRYAVAAVGPADEQIRSDSLTVTTPEPNFSTELRQNYPNPFNPQTKIEFELAESGPVRLAIYTARGELVEVLVDGVLEAGEHDYLWRPGITSPAVASAPYFYRLETREGELTRKMILLR